MPERCKHQSGQPRDEVSLHAEGVRLASALEGPYTWLAVPSAWNLRAVRPRTELFSSEYHRVELDAPRCVIWLVRTSQPYPDLAAVRAAQDGVLDALRRCTHLRPVMLVDLRAGPSRNDPEFEQLAKRFRQELFSIFRRSAVLVRMASGLMQLTRYARTDGLGTGVFTSEDEAIAYLLE
jgi:hypothetical protein